MGNEVIYSGLDQIAYTDYPFAELGDKPRELAPVRRCLILDYDGDKYCKIAINNMLLEVKSGYLYIEKGRLGESPCVPQSVLNWIADSPVVTDTWENLHRTNEGLQCSSCYKYFP